MIAFDSIEVGQLLPELLTTPISRTTLALYACASGDHNPIHIDIDFARAAGMDDVFAHGMLPMAYLGRLLTAWVPQRQIRSFDVRFTSIAHVGSRITCTGEVTEKIEYNNEKLVSVKLQAVDQHDDVKLTGSAAIVF